MKCEVMKTIQSSSVSVIVCFYGNVYVAAFSFYFG